MREKLESFLLEDLPSLVSKEIEDATWQLTKSCVNCNFVKYCKKEVRNMESLGLRENGPLVSAIPYLDKADLLWIHGLLTKRRGEDEAKVNPGNVLLTDIEDLVLDGTLESAERARVRDIMGGEHLPIGIEAEGAEGAAAGASSVVAAGDEAASRPHSTVSISHLVGGV